MITIAILVALLFLITVAGFIWLIIITEQDKSSVYATTTLTTKRSRQRPQWWMHVRNSLHTWFAGIDRGSRVARCFTDLRVKSHRIMNRIKYILGLALDVFIQIYLSVGELFSKPVKLDEHEEKIS